MKLFFLKKSVFYFKLLNILFFVQTIQSQTDPVTTQKENNFWSKVQFGGNIGLGVSGNTFNAVIAPSAVYQFNSFFSLGTGLHFGYSNGLNFTATNYGASIIALSNPIPGLQFSAEFEQMGVNRNLEIEGIQQDAKENFWYPALFLGAGYRIGPVTTGLRYDVLYNENRSIYASPYAPFVRVFW